MKVNYGIYLGTTSTSIAKMEAGSPVIIRSNTLKDSTPVAVFINRKGAIQVGDAAINAYKINKLNEIKTCNSGCNDVYIEFTRTLGSDAEYFSCNANRSFSSEELLAEIIKTLLSFEKDIDIVAAVLSVPSTFKLNQINAVRKTGYLAGLKQVEIITEDLAGAFAFGVDSIRMQGYTLFFKFTSSYFSCSLLKSENGIVSVKNTECENYLGGKNLDEAIIDKLIIPHLKENFVIDKLLRDSYKNTILRATMKFYAEEIKKQLSYSDETSILTNWGDIPEKDDEGNELELDITVTTSILESVLAPIFQKAIDISLELLKRNNIDGSKLTSLILAGKPTLSPTLRKMLAEQICEPDTSIDPENVIAKGAAIYASTVDLTEEPKALKKDKLIIQLEINFEPTSEFDEEDGVIKILQDKTESEIPSKVFANVSRQDGGWSIGNVEINTIGEIVTVQLEKGKSNAFSVSLFDDKGNKLECEPSNFNILQGGKGGSAVLPYNIGIEIQDRNTGKLLFKTIEGLSKSKQLPASGTISNYKTPRELRPGVESDFFELAIYQGEHGADGTRAIFNEHIYDIVVSGAKLPCFLPKESEVDLIILVDPSLQLSVRAYFPSIDFSIDVQVCAENKSSESIIDKTETLLFELTENEILTGSEFQKYFEQLSKLKKHPDFDVLNKILNQLNNYGLKA